MKSSNSQTLFALVFCLCLFAINISAQKNKEPEVKAEPVETKSEAPAPAPEPEPGPTNDSSPTYEPPASKPTQNESPVTKVDTQNNSSVQRTTIRNDFENRRRRELQREEIERQNREDRGRNRRGKEKDKDQYNNCPIYDPFGDCNNNTDESVISVKASANPFGYFNSNDIAYFYYQKFIENDSAKYLPYFQSPLDDDFKPLYSVGFVEVPPDLPFRTLAWTFYYEPDLKNFFIDFQKLNQKGQILYGPTRFDRMVLKSIGNKTIKRVGKHFNYQGKIRPVLVEDISTFALDRIYTFNIQFLPEGNYQLLLLSKTGTTAKLDFKVEK